MTNRSAYASHSWTSRVEGYLTPADHGGPHCADCGIENLGDPEEFPDMEYPECEKLLLDGASAGSRLALDTESRTPVTFITSSISEPPFFFDDDD